MRLKPRFIAVAVATVTGVGAALPAAASAHGNPVTEVLATDIISLPQNVAVDGEIAKRLRGVLTAARLKGQNFRVAVIASPADLGNEPNFWNFPEETATYVSRDLASHGLVTRSGKPEPVLVVMPDGVGTVGLTPAATRAVRSVEVPSDAGPDVLAAAAGYGVQRAMEATGRPIPATFDKPDVPGSGSGALLPLVVMFGLAGLAGAFIVLRARGAQRPGEDTQAGR